MNTKEIIYTCPMHPEIERTKPGICPKCGMKLVIKGVAKKENPYQPLFIIIALIILSTAVIAYRDLLIGNFSWSTVMMNFMAGFFLVFGGFKLLDLKGFAEGYATYDLLAKKFYEYGHIYPFLELGLGLLYLTHFVNPTITLFTFFLMAFSGIGVAINVAKKEQFQCACLGTFLKVPLTKVTLIEDFGMAAMALGMYLFSAGMWGGTQLGKMQETSISHPSMQRNHGAHEQDHAAAIASEKDFIVAMIPHHQEAIDASHTISEQTNSSELKKFATAVITAQSAEVTQMNQWLQEWYPDTKPSEITYLPMMENLQNLHGTELDRAYVVGMIAHHLGAIDMAKKVLTLHPRPEVQKMAEDIIAVQQLEVDDLRVWLEIKQK